MTRKTHKPVHPGEILWHEFLVPMGITRKQLAVATAMPADCVTRLVKGTRAFTGDTTMRLARYFGTSLEVWMNLQVRYDLDVATDCVASKIAKEVKPYRAA